MYWSPLFLCKNLSGFLKEKVPSAFHNGERTGECQLKNQKTQNKMKEKLSESSVDNGIVSYDVGEVGIGVDHSGNEYYVVTI